MNKLFLLSILLLVLMVGSVSAYDFPVGTQAFFPFEQNTSNLARDYFPLSGSPSYVSGIYDDYAVSGVVGNGTPFLMDVADNNYYPSFSTCLTRDLLSVPTGQSQYRFFQVGFQNTGGVNSNIYQAVSFWQSRTVPQIIRVLFNSQTDGRVDVLANTTGIYKMCFTYDRPSNNRLLIVNGVNYTLPVTTESPYAGISVGVAEVNAVYDNLWVINRSLTNEEVANYMECGLIAGCCEPNWSCSGYEDCVYPASSVGCDSVLDLNTCDDVYAGNFSEFSGESCDYSGQAVVVTGDSYVAPPPSPSPEPAPVEDEVVVDEESSPNLLTGAVTSVGDFFSRDSATVNVTGEEVVLEPSVGLWQRVLNFIKNLFGGE